MSFIRKNLSNIIGFNTKRKIIVLESDDWGSIRMPSVRVYEKLINSGLDLKSDGGAGFNKYDSLATTDDLGSLFEVLDSYKDKTGRSPVMTPIVAVANPDFKQIKESGFSDYYFEPFTTTLQKYPGCENSFQLWKEGISQRLFVPQFHGREHLNVKVWMRALKAGNKSAILAFNNEMWGIPTAQDPEIKIEFQAAFDFIDPVDLLYHEEIIRSGLDLFKDLLGYQATYFVPPNGPFSSKLEKVCTDSGINFLATSKIESEPKGNRKTRKRFHWLGQMSGTGLMYMTRNCHFEPHQLELDWVDSCLSDISLAYKWNKPAVISSHRVNYIGALHPENRGNGLRNLHRLLINTLKYWPDTEFLTTNELGELIINGKDN